MDALTVGLPPGPLPVGMLFGMSRAASPTPPWNVRLNVGGTNTEFEYQNPRVPQCCNFRKLASEPHVSSAAL